MIRGRLIAMGGGRRRPFVLAHITIASQGIADDINTARALCGNSAAAPSFAPSAPTRGHGPRLR